MRLPAAITLAACALLASACEAKSPTAPTCLATPQAAVLPLTSAPARFDTIFDRAAAQYGVPAELLSAIGYVETRWQMLTGQEELGQPAAHGVMALRGDRLNRGSSLAGVPVSAAQAQASANVSAAAALLGAYAKEFGDRPGSLEAWAPVLERFSGITLAAGASAYADAVVAVAVSAHGGKVPGQRPAANLLSDDCKPPPPVIPPVQPVGPDYGGSFWRPSPNFNSRPADGTGTPRMLIIHTCEGGYIGCWSWLTNPVSQVSSHYVVNEEGTEIVQLVQEPSRAWHIGANYRCVLNRMRECGLTGIQSNHFTIGIEHGGYAAQPAFPDAQIDASARLACDITRDHNIPRDWQHIVAHGQLQPENRTDPGPNWPWVKYVTRVQRFCGEIVVDDESAYNDAAVASAAGPGTWAVSDSTPGYYASGYRWVPTSESTTDPFIFRFHVDQPGTRTLDARWTSGTNRSPDAAYTIVSSSGATLGSASRDQRTGNGWNPLGTWTFSIGWNEVHLSRGGTPGAVVVADAIRIR